VIKVANKRVHQDEQIDFRRLRRHLSHWPGIDRTTWRYLLPGRNLKLSQGSDSPVRRQLASAWVWAKASSGDFRLAPGGIPRSPYQYELFARSFIPKLQPRLDILARFVRWNPQESQENLRGMLIGELIDNGSLPSRTTNGHLDPKIAERVLRFVSNDSGVDMETLLAGSESVDVREARHLAASLMKVTAGCNWTPIGEIFGTRGNSSSIRRSTRDRHRLTGGPMSSAHRNLLERIRNASISPPSFAQGAHPERDSE
jgi:hypothetical protein